MTTAWNLSVSVSVSVSDTITPRDEVTGPLAADVFLGLTEEEQGGRDTESNGYIYN